MDGDNNCGAGWRLLRALALGWLASVLAAGCAAPPIAKEQKLSGNEGAVVLKLITGGNADSDAADTLSMLQLERIAPTEQKRTNERVSLMRTRQTTQSSAVFSGMLAPGRYKILNATGGQGDMTYTFPMEAMVSPFDVKYGEVTLLGTVVVQQTGGRRFNVGYVPPDEEFRATFQDLFPGLVEQTRDRPVNSFDLTLEMQGRAALAPRLKALATPSGGVHVAGDGGVYLGGRMGKALWRDPLERAWHRADVGSWKAVESVRPYKNGLLVAGEEGLLRYSADEGRTWRALNAPTRGLIAAAEPLPNGKVVLLARHGSEWSAYISDDALAGPWRKLGTFADERSLNVPWQLAKAVATGNRAGVMMPNGVFHVVDGDTGQIEHVSTGLSAFTVAAMPDGMLVMQGAIVTRTTLISIDGGKTWTDLDTNRFIQTIAFADRRTAYAIGPIKPGVFSGDFALMASSDGAKTWTRTGDLPGGKPFDTRELRWDRQNAALLAFMRDGSVMRSVDRGQSWTREP